MLRSMERPCARRRGKGFIRRRFRDKKKTEERTGKEKRPGNVRGEGTTVKKGAHKNGGTSRGSEHVKAKENSELGINLGPRGEKK